MTASNSPLDKNLTTAEATLVGSLSAKVESVSSQLIVLKYEPYAARQRWLEHRFSDWNSTKTFFAYLVVFLSLPLLVLINLGVCYQWSESFIILGYSFYWHRRGGFRNISGCDFGFD